MYFREVKCNKFELSLQSYKSIGLSFPVETKEKGSKFIGCAACVRTEEEVKLKLEEWHAEHPSATHICYAYRMGLEGEVYRANDDGEPNNSAGAPILGQILSADLTNVIVGVVRYYGGTKLGVGGLVQAYKAAAKEVLDEAEVIEYQLNDYYQLNCNYLDMPHVMNVLKRNCFEIVETIMEKDCTLVLKCDPAEPNQLEELLAMYSSVEIKYIERK